MIPVFPDPATAPGSITVDLIDVNQSLELRSANGAVTANTVTVNDVGASLTLASGGAGSGVISDMSLSTNGGDILLASEGDIDVALVTTTLNPGAPPAPTAGSIVLLTDGNAAVSDGLYAGEDAWIRATGNIGSAGAPVIVNAGDDIFLQSVGGGDLFVASATTDGGGNDNRSPSFSGVVGALTTFSPIGEFFPGAQILISGGNLFGPALGGSTGSALILRDLTVGSADLDALLGDVRIGDLSATVGDIAVDAAAGSISGLQNGWTVTTGGSAISTTGNIQFQITGAIEVGTLSGAAVSNISSQQIRIGAITADSVTLTGVDQLQIDSGTVTGAATLTTTGGTAAAFALTGSPLVANHVAANLTTQGAVTANALTGAAQLGAISGTSIDVSASAIDLQSATSTLAAINATANTGQLTLGTASSATTLTLDKTGVTGALIVNGALTSVDDLSADSSTTLTADSLVSNNGGIALTSTGNTTITTAQADNGAFTSDITIAGDFTATSITAQSVAITDGANAFTGGDITIGSLTSEQTLALRTSGGSIDIDEAAVTDAGASLTLAVGGAGETLTSSTSISTNGGDILLAAEGDVDLALVTTTLSAATPPVPTAGSITVLTNGDAAISGGIYAGEDAWIRATGNVGSAVALVVMDAGDDIFLQSVGGGDIFLASATTDGLGPDDRTPGFSGAVGTLVALSSSGEFFPGAQMLITGGNLFGAALGGSTGAALILRDLTVGSADLEAQLGDVRIGDLAATTGDLAIDAGAGSVSGLQDGWAATTGGSTISATGDIQFQITGAIEVGSLTGADVSNTGSQQIRIGAITADSVTLTGVDQLQIDSGIVTGTATLTTTGGTAGAFALTGSPLVAGHGATNLDAAGGVSVTASSGAVQINSVAAGDGITIDSAAADILSAVSATGGVSVTAISGQLSLTDATGAGDILLVKNGTEGALVAGTSSSSGGNVTATSSTNASLTSVTSTIGDIAVTTTGGDIAVTTATAGNNIALDASGDIDATTLTGNGGLTAIAGGDVAIGAATMGGLIDVAAGDDIAVGTLDGRSVLLDAAGDVSGLADGASTETLVPGFGRGDLSADLDIAVNAGGNVQLGTLDSGTSTFVSGSAVALTSTAAGTTVDVAATDGELTVDTVSAGTTISLIKTGATDDLTAGTLTAGGDISATSSTALDLTNVTSTGGALTAIAANGDATIGTGSAAGDITLTGSNDAAATTLTGGGDLLVTAGNDGTVGTGTMGGSITIDAGNTAGGGALSGNDVTLSGFAVNATNVDAGTGALTGTATGGDLFIGTGTATGTIALTKTGDIANFADGITSNALTSTAGDILLDSSTFVNVGSSNAAGLLSIISPETVVAASLASDGSIAINTGGDAQLGDITAGVSLILLAAGDISADILTVGEDIAALSAGSITIGDFTAGDNVTMTAATTLDLGGGSTTGGGADNNTYILDLALAGTSDPNAITDGPADAVDGDILLEAPDDFALTGTISVAATDGTLTVRNLAGGAGISTSVGTSGGFEISEAELGFLAADNVVVDAGDQPLALGNIAIASGTGTQSLQLLSSSDITLSGVVSGAGTGTLQIGVGEIGTTGLVDPATLSTSITATTETAGIDFAGGIVDLRAVRIVFGLTDFVALAQGASLEQAALLVTDGGSQLYIGDNSQNVFLQAGTLRVAYSDFALFQNTSFSLGGGAILNADGANSVSELALELFSQGNDNLDSFAIFGEVNGFTGRTAGVLPNAVLNIGTLSPRELRVTQARSRVNGCVIGSPDRGCLIVDLPPPEITTIDERQAQDLISTDDPSAFLNPLVGRGNEGLILDIAQVPVGIDTIDCDPETETCEPTEPAQ